MRNSMKSNLEKQLLYVYCDNENNIFVELNHKNILNHEHLDDATVFSFSDMKTLENKINLISEEDFLYAVYSLVATYAHIRNETNGKAEVLLDPKYCFYNATDNLYKYAFVSAENATSETVVKDFVWNLIFDAVYINSDIDVVSELLNFLRTSRKVSAEDVMLIIELCKYGEKIVAQYRKPSLTQKNKLQDNDDESADVDIAFKDDITSVEFQSDVIYVETNNLIKESQEKDSENASVNQSFNIISAGECTADFSNFLSNDIGFSGVYTKETTPENISREEEYLQSKNKTVTDFSSFLFGSSDCSPEIKSIVSESFGDNSDKVSTFEETEFGICQINNKKIDCTKDKIEIDSECVEDEIFEEENIVTEDEVEVAAECIEDESFEEENYRTEDEDEIAVECIEDESFEEESCRTEDEDEIASECVEDEYFEEESSYIEDEVILYAEDIEVIYAEVENKIESENKDDRYENIWSCSSCSETNSAELCFLSGESFNIVKPVCNIGRNAVWSDIELKDGRVSRQHAVIEYNNSGYYIYDIKSANGTYINGRKLLAGETKLLAEGDIIRIGVFELHFRYTNKK